MECASPLPILKEFCRNVWRRFAKRRLDILARNVRSKQSRIFHWAIEQTNSIVNERLENERLERSVFCLRLGGRLRLCFRPDKHLFRSTGLRILRARGSVLFLLGRRRGQTPTVSLLCQNGTQLLGETDSARTNQIVKKTCPLRFE